MDIYSYQGGKIWICLPLLALFRNRKTGTKMDNTTILLVEDNPEEVDLTLRAFKKNNIVNQISVVKDGKEALDFLFCRNTYADRDPHNLPLLTLMDLKLPKMNGLEVLRCLRADQRTKTMPVVILTSSNEKQDLIRSYESGANSYVRKPIDFTQFLESIRQIGLYWLALNEAPPG
jgi:CheY-like chemotaxis protein